jgi:hypothetical protein
MGNDYEQHDQYAEYKAMMHDLALRVPRHQAELGVPMMDDFRIGYAASVMRPAADGTVELASRRSRLFQPLKSAPSSRPAQTPV